MTFFPYDVGNFPVPRWRDFISAFIIRLPNNIESNLSLSRTFIISTLFLGQVHLRLGRGKHSGRNTCVPQWLCRHNHPHVSEIPINQTDQAAFFCPVLNCPVLVITVSTAAADLSVIDWRESNPTWVFCCCSSSATMLYHLFRGDLFLRCVIPPIEYLSELNWTTPLTVTADITHCFVYCCVPNPLHWRRAPSEMFWISFPVVSLKDIWIVKYFLLYFVQVFTDAV